MREAHLPFLMCPDCHHDLCVAAVDERDEDQIVTGSLSCSDCHKSFPILRGIPRFVPLSNYADGFDFQWNKHALTQHDSHSGSTVSEDRFFKETRWPRDLKGETILEVGCGSGRFTAQAISTGAMVVATDLSGAVDANYRVHQHVDKLLLVQSDIYHMPFRLEAYDKVFCIGVLQHTPNVKKSFMTLPRYLKPGGSLVTDVYDKRDGLLGFVEIFYRTYYWLRPITRRMPTQLLYRMVSTYIRLMWPLAKLINRIPVVGRKLNRMLLIIDYRGRYDLSEEMLQEWSILDTFDTLSPAYDQRQTIDTFQGWFEEARLDQVDVHYGYNGIEGRAVKC
jgi:ubiquinone/menaquinone biosynthesis C-methylase UbiE/uncharacterized protein YbaR (Trm112 family)